MKNKYEVIGIVGEGAYGIVYKCKNKETGKYVAIKKFKETEDKLVQKTMKRELAMLQMLRHENIVEFQESFVNKGNFFLVFEYVEKNLLEVLEESPNGLSPKLIRSFVYQMCKAVSYLHKNNMIHRDVKPENLLIDENLNLKLCDFGFARKIKLNKQNNNVDTMTDYVATRWYRSPELLLSGGIYGPEVDYWAIGCIMGELADGNPMFPGENEVDQLDCIIKILGNLPEELVNMYYENPIYNEKELFKVKKPETLEKRYLGILSPTAIDFMKGLLELDPSKRLNGDTVFKHKYFKIFMDEEKNKQNNINNTNANADANANANENVSNNNTINKESKKNNQKIIIKNISHKKIIKEPESKTESKIDNNVIPTKVINNTTNINIINYNMFNNSPGKNNVQIPKKILDMNQAQKSQYKNLTNNDNSQKNNNKSKEQKDSKYNQNLNKTNSIISQNKINTLTKSLINFNNYHINNKIIGIKNPIKSNSKKSFSMNKIKYDYDYSNILLPQKFSTNEKISLSQGKSYKNNFNKEIIKPENNTFYNLNLKVVHNNKNNDYNKNTNLISLLNKGYSTNGFKFLYKKDDKYNYKINTNYIKEQNKKYLNNNSYYDKNIIDEKEEFVGNDSNIYGYKKKSYSKGKNNKKLLVPFGQENFDLYNTKNYKNHKGYGTFYKNNNINGNQKKSKNKNINKLPNLYKSINNETQYDYFGYKKKTKSNNNLYYGKKPYNPYKYDYDYSSKFRFYIP